MKNLFIITTLLSLSGCMSYPSDIDSPTEAFAEKKGVVDVIWGCDGGNEAKTVWKRLNSDNKPVYLTGVEPNLLLQLFNPNPSTSRHQKALAPGTYAATEVGCGKGDYYKFLKSENVSWWNRTGWDSAANTPRIISFDVKAGEITELPKMSVVGFGNDKVRLRVEDQAKHKYRFGKHVEIVQ